MSKQDKIRDGIALKLALRDGYDESASKYYLPEADSWLSYFHSQGVVIKVDRELPPCNPQHDENFRMGWDACGGAITNTGYVAVEPLRKEVETMTVATLKQIDETQKQAEMMRKQLDEAIENYIVARKAHLDALRVHNEE